jgi:protein-disulfide isomerase
MDNNEVQAVQKSSNKALWITGVVVALVVVALITNGFGIFNSGNSITGGTTGTVKVPLAIGESPVLGNENASVTIYEFSDFSCPYCAIADKNLLPSIEQEYVNTGKAKIVFKYFPGHGQGEASQIVGYALNYQNPELFWKFADLAFSNQADTGDLDKMKALASNIGADMNELNSYIASNKANFMMQQDIQMAQANGVQGTPTFIVNGKTIVGVSSYSDFKKVIDSAL